MLRKILIKEIEYYSKVYDPNCKKVRILKHKLKKLKSKDKIF